MRSTTSSRLFDAVLAAPNDVDAIRVYADALLAADDEHGEAIQLACRLDTMTPGDPARRTIARKLDALMLGNQERWLAPLRAAFGGVRGVVLGLVRGLPAHVDAGTDDLVDGLEAATRVAPIVSLRTFYFDTNLAKLAMLPAFRRVTRLSLIRTRASAKILAPAFGALPALERLAIAPLMPDAARALARSPLARTLRHLDVEGGDGLAFEQLAPLVEHGALVELRLRGCRIDAGAIAAIARCEGLRVLALHHCEIDAAAARRLADEPAFAAVEELGLGGNPLKSAGLAAIAASKSLANVVRVSFGRAGGGDPPFGTKALTAFADALAWRKLRALDLTLCSLRADSVALLAGKPFAKLEELDLTANLLGDAGVAALAKLALPKLRVLRLDTNSIRAAGMTKLARAPWLAQLEDLALRHNKFGSPGGQALGTGNLAKLEVLRLGHNWMGTQGLRAILHASPSLARVSNGVNNFAPSEFIASLLTADTPPPLRELDVYGLTAKQLDELAVTPRVASLRVLELHADKLDDARAEKLAASKHLANLRVFRLRALNLGERGRAALRARFGDRLDLVV